MERSDSWTNTGTKQSRAATTGGNRNEASFRKQTLWPYTKHDPNRLEDPLRRPLKISKYVLPREITTQFPRRNGMEGDI